MSETHSYSFSVESTKLAVIGLGYVGLPLAAEFGKHQAVVGFDVNSRRIEELQAGYDATLELSEDELSCAQCLKFTSDVTDLKACNVFIVTVPTPIDVHKTPDLTPLLKASETLGKVLKRDDIVIYESTVYPGATEDECVPVLERYSDLQYNVDFFVGYSPERINPGDKEHRLTTIPKVTSGSTAEIATFIDGLYASVISAGTYKASSIRVAEAAKVIENTQRDLNIALVNELAMIFDRLGLDTLEVLQAAGTKWNFLPFRPGLVGGHCIGVDPYYLTYKAQSIGYYPELILAGRRINDGMAGYAVSKLVKAMIKRDTAIQGAKVLIMGFTFKENCPDVRNTKVWDLLQECESYGTCADVYDPLADGESVKLTYGVSLLPDPKDGVYDAVILAVSHQQFREMGLTKVRGFCKPSGIIFDLKNTFSSSLIDLQL